jgi:hypothetical protein
VKTKAIVLLICIVGALALAAPAMAQSVGTDAYGGGVQGVSGSGGNGDVSSGTTTHNTPGAVASESNSGGLPFTGLEVGVVLAGGVLLLGTGLAVRRLSSGDSPRPS